jgi:hypothetical protein
VALVINLVQRIIEELVASLPDVGIKLGSLRIDELAW